MQKIKRLNTITYNKSTASQVEKMSIMYQKIMQYIQNRKTTNIIIVNLTMFVKFFA